MAIEVIEKKDTRMRTPAGGKAVFLTLFCVAMALFHFYTAYVGPYTPMVQRGVHLAFGFALIFLLYPVAKSSRREYIPIYDWLLALLSVVVLIYAVVNFTEITAQRLVQPTVLDKVLGVTALLIVMEVTRRTSGNALTLVVIGFVLYAFAGQYIPGVFSHPGIKLKYLISYNYMSLDGIFGSPTGASATEIFVLVVFGIVMLKLGGGEWFLSASYALLGTVKGGPAKIAVAASALFGTITGVGPANVAATGVFTIPLMKKVGYRPHFAGAVEAVASSGGQIMPPVMGAAAFIMAEILTVSYLKICLSALIPSLLYFIAVYVMVHLEAVKNNLMGLPREELPDARIVLLSGWPFWLPLLLLIFMIGYHESSPAKAALFAMGLLLASEVFRQVRSRKYDALKIVRAVESGVATSLVICSVVAAVGIIMSIINVTGIGLRLSGILVSLSGGHLPVLLVITMFASLLLGMGLTTVACYIILAVLAAPALVEMGVDPIAAHMFVFYFGIISGITPPVALASYVAAGIADSSPMKTSWTSLRLGLAAFILPYMFVYSPSLMMKGDVGGIALSAVTAIIGVVALAVALQGYFMDHVKPLARGLCFLGALLLIHSGLWTDLMGIFLILVGLAGQFTQAAKRWTAKPDAGYAQR